MAAVTIAAGVTHLSQNRATVQDSTPVQARTQPVDLAEDNRLLSSIDAALSYRADIAVDALKLQNEKRDRSSGGDSPEVTE